MKIMNKIRCFLRIFFTGEAGLALPLALVLLVTGALLVMPVLNLVTESLRTGLLIEQRAMGAYAAEAGILDVYWRFKKATNITDVTSTFPHTLSNTINGMTVTYDKATSSLYEDLPDGTRRYSVRSVAKDSHNVIQGTAVAQFGGGPNFANLLDRGIVSDNNVTIQPGSNIVGDITAGGSISYNDKQVNIDGNQSPNTVLIIPTCDQMKTYYWNNSLPYWNGTITNPLGPLRTGTAKDQTNYGLNITGTANLEGVIYVNGDFYVGPNSTLNLSTTSKPTVFATGTIDVKPGATVNGSGCFIACGNVSFQPNTASQSGVKLLGVDSPTTPITSVNANNLCLVRVQAAESGTLRLLRIYNNKNPGEMKMGIYADNGGTPGILLAGIDFVPNSSPQNNYNTVTDYWSEITLGKNTCPIVKNNWYWLAANSSANGIINSNSTANTSRLYTPVTFGTLFPQYVGSTGYTQATNKSYLFTGYDSNYILLMSVGTSSSVTLQPNGSFNGTVVGNASVGIQPGYNLTWVSPDGVGINFPGVVGGSGNAAGTLSMTSYSSQ
jgi:Tfp pilus assembly protein PilX